MGLDYRVRARVSFKAFTSKGRAAEATLRLALLAGSHHLVVKLTTSCEHLQACRCAEEWRCSETFNMWDRAS